MPERELRAPAECIEQDGDPCREERLGEGALETAWEAADRRCARGSVETR